MINYAREQMEEKIAQCGDALTDLKRHQKEGTVDYLRAHPDTYFAVCYRFILYTPQLAAGNRFGRSGNLRFPEYNL